jgi:hypothetical protein
MRAVAPKEKKIIRFYLAMKAQCSYTEEKIELNYPGIFFRNVATKDMGYPCS